jgi:hypothetical protein
MEAFEAVRWRFTDKVLHFAAWESLLTLKAGSLEEYCLPECLGLPKGVPAVLLMESCLQSARWLVEASSGFSLSCELLDIERWQVAPGLEPGERYCAFVRVRTRDNTTIDLALRQKIVRAGEALPDEAYWRDDSQDDAWFVCTFVPLDERCPPDDRASLWGEMCG